MKAIALLPLLFVSPPQETPASWPADDAAHLLRRAGFGGTPEEIAALAARGKEGAVDFLVDFEKAPFDFPSPTVSHEAEAPRGGMRDLSEEERQAARQMQRVNRVIQARNVSDWWVRRMAETPRPLEEKLVLFWHGHFTSGLREVESAEKMYQQNQLFREHAADFAALLQRVSKDPAMVRYLDTDKNVKRKPNENFAREVMELFTLGEGNYTETDIKEAARAFTGWTVDRQSGEFHERRGQHDGGSKTVFGETGNWNGDDILHILLKQPACAEFLARKLWRFFAATEPSAQTVADLAKTLRESGYQLKPMLRRMFLSPAFYAPETRFANIKSPVELVVGSFRELGIAPRDAETFHQKMKQMGQELLQPPNVKGWDGGRKWIDAASLYQRYNFAADLLFGTGGGSSRKMMAARMKKAGMEDLPEDFELAKRDESPPQPPFDPEPILNQFELRSAEKIVDHFARRLLHRPLDAEPREALLDFLKKNAQDLGNPSAKDLDAVRGLIHLLMSMPEYQVS